MRIPEAKAAVNKEWDKSKKLPAWDEKKNKAKTEVARPAKKDGKTVHFGNLMDLCHLKNAKLANSLQKYKGESCSGKATSRTKKDTEQYSQSKALQHHRWQWQHDWTLSQSFLVWLEKQVNAVSADSLEGRQRWIKKHFSLKNHLFKKVSDDRRG